MRVETEDNEQYMPVNELEDSIFNSSSEQRNAEERDSMVYVKYSDDKRKSTNSVGGMNEIQVNTENNPNSQAFQTNSN